MVIRESAVHGWEVRAALTPVPLGAGCHNGWPVLHLDNRLHTVPHAYRYKSSING